MPRWFEGDLADGRVRDTQPSVHGPEGSKKPHPRARLSACFLVGRAGLEPATNGLKVEGIEKTGYISNTLAQPYQCVSCSRFLPLSPVFWRRVSRQCPALPHRERT